MKWNWQQKDWPEFSYDPKKLQKLEEEFLYSSGTAFGAFKHLSDHEKENLKIELISDEALKTSQIEGECLSRDSLQASIRRNFGLASDNRRVSPSEKGICDMMFDIYTHYAQTLTHDSLFCWHEMLTSGRRDLQHIGQYRAHLEPMEIISGRLDSPTIHFEAPPSQHVKKEMDAFIAWFNNSNNLPALTRAAITHLYFVSIHPFEDGNGRIARALTIKALSQSINQPLLTSFSTIVQEKKKEYYKALETNNKHTQITDWIIYFANVLLESHQYTQQLIEFLIAKAHLFAALKDQLNARQEKLLNRMFKAGINGFEGGLSAENYISITKTSRPTATRDLKELVDKGALIKTGELKGSRYYLNLSKNE